MPYFVRVLCVLFFICFAFSIAYFLLTNADNPQDLSKYASDSTVFETKGFSSESIKKIKHGKLSKFYNCLMIKDVQTRDYIGKGNHAKLWISDHMYISLSLRGSTVISYHLAKLQGGIGKTVLVSSDRVWCDLSLLEEI